MKKYGEFIVESASVSGIDLTKLSARDLEKIADNTGYRGTKFNKSKFLKMDNVDDSVYQAVYQVYFADSEGDEDEASVYVFIGRKGKIALEFD